MSNQVKSETKQGLFVYVVRWQKRVDGEDKFGNLDVCYTNEKDAEKAMLQLKVLHSQYLLRLL